MFRSAENLNLLHPILATVDRFCSSMDLPKASFALGDWFTGSD